MLAATVAFSIDAMLPALPEIGAELAPDNPNVAQLVITSFVFGMGFGTFVAGPLSDRFGRKPIVAGGAALYCLGALWAYFAQDLTAMLLARAVQGLGASGPRVVSLAMIRDLYSGQGMARILSFVMMVFTTVPAIAPTLGFAIIAYGHWRGVFVAFAIFAVLGLIWLTLRQPETLAPENRKSLELSSLWQATCEVMANPTTRLSILVQTLSFGMLFLTISTTQQVFDETYGRGEHFHFWFGGIAIAAATASIVNAYYVVRIGMRAIIRLTLLAQTVLALCMCAVILAPLPENVEFAAYVFWTISLFYQAGLTIGNLNALALEPMGHIAGLASSAVAAFSTVGGVALSAPVGLLFNGTALPMAVACAVAAAIGAWLTTMIRRDSGSF